MRSLNQLLTPPFTLLLNTPPPLLLTLPTSLSKHDYNFGLLESEPVLVRLCEEDLAIQAALTALNATRSNQALAEYLATAYREAGREAREHVRHPVNAYNLIKRAAVYSREAVELIRRSNHSQLADEVELLINGTTVFRTVGSKDMVGALHGLTMIIHTYKLDIEQLRRGRFIGEKDGAVFVAAYGLDVHDLVFLAQTAEDEGYINTAASLLRSALIAGQAEGGLDATQLKTLKKKRKTILTLHNGLLKKRQSFLSDKDVLNTYMLDGELGRSSKQPKFVSRGESRRIDWSSMRDHGGIFSEMERLLEGCRDFPLSPPSSRPPHRLNRRCRHLHHGDPFHRLAPFKVEIASSLPDPHIVVVHEVLAEEDIRHWVDWAGPRLSTRREDSIRGPKVPAKPDRTPGKVRIVYKAVQAWKTTILFEGEKDVDVGKGQGYPGLGNYTPGNFTVLDPRAERLSRRLERALALNVTNQWSSHTYQVTNYGLAGTCEAHVDPHGYLEGRAVSGERQGLRVTGDYIGTTMGWLEDTPAGGATTFFSLGQTTTIRPTRGAVAFWFSLLADGRRDPQTSHGGCPVAVGSKWIINKWVYSFNQWARHPCGRSPTSHSYAAQRLAWPATSYF